MMTNEQREQLEGLFAAAKHLGLNDWEEIFLTNIEARYKMWGSKSNFTAKQWVQIGRIEEKNL